MTQDPNLPLAEQMQSTCRRLSLCTLMKNALEGLETTLSVLDGRQPAEMMLAVLMQPFALGWREQQIAIRFGPGTPKSD